MKAVYVVKTYDPKTGTPGEVACLDAPKPEITAPDDVLIRVAYASLCGSDAHYIRDNLFPFPAPFPAGHELSGVIEDLGPEAAATGLRTGDAVTGDFVLGCGCCEACRRGQGQFCTRPHVNGAAQAEYIVWKAAQVYRLPPGTDLLEGALFEPFTIAVGAMDRAELKAGQSVFVLGAGGIGQMLIQLAAQSGASLVGTSVRTGWKRKLAVAMGGDYAFNPQEGPLEEQVRAAAGESGFDVVLEASGNLECARQALELVRPGGTVVFLSYYPPGSILPLDLFGDVITKELTLKGMQLAQNSWARAMEMFPRMNLRPLISKLYPLEACKEAYQDLVSGKYLKLVLDCTDQRDRWVKSGPGQF